MTTEAVSKVGYAHSKVAMKKKSGYRSRCRRRNHDRYAPDNKTVPMVLQRLFLSCKDVFTGPGTVPAPSHVQMLCSILGKCFFFLHFIISGPIFLFFIWPLHSHDMYAVKSEPIIILHPCTYILSVMRNFESAIKKKKEKERFNIIKSIPLCFMRWSMKDGKGALLLNSFHVTSVFQSIVIIHIAT